MTNIKPFIWKLIKNTSFVKDIGFSLYHLLKKNRKCIQGHGNIIDIQSDDNPPQLQNVFFDIIGDENLIIIKPGASIKNFKIHLRGKKHQVLIEENVRIKSGLFWFNDEQGKIFIGKGTTIRQAEVGIAESGTSVTIGEDCMLAGGIEIRTGDSHSIINLSNQKRLNPARNIQIGNHVWIAKYVQILKGVSIGCNSIIGIRSVVTKDIPENSLAVGIPAKVSKTDVSWTREKIRV